MTLPSPPFYWLLNMKNIHDIVCFPPLCCLHALIHAIEDFSEEFIRVYKVNLNPVEILTRFNEMSCTFLTVRFSAA